MAPQASLTGEPAKPSSSQLIIALFLAKSKPSGLSAQGTATPVTNCPASSFFLEYASSLRECVKRGCRLEGQPSANHHVDTLAFWKDAFKKSEDAQNELRAKVFELEKRLEARNEPKIENPVSHRKRKRDLDNATAEPARTTISGNGGFLAAIADDVKHLSDRKGKDIYLSFDGTSAS